MPVRIDRRFYLEKKKSSDERGKTKFTLANLATLPRISIYVVSLSDSHSQSSASWRILQLLPMAKTARAVPTTSGNRTRTEGYAS